MLLTRVSIPPPPVTEPEDIFHSALTTIFTDDTVNSHGTPGSYVTYQSPRFGDLKLHIPAHPDVEDGRKLFAHYLWNAAVVAADGIESASTLLRGHHGSPPVNKDAQWNRKYFDVRSKTTLELGAGTALPSLIAALSGASSCTVTDHPSSPALTTGAIEKNVQGANLASRSKTEVSVLGYAWGTSTFYLPSKYGKPAPPQTSEHLYDRIIIADCLWMPSQHINLIRTILQLLRPSQTALQKDTNLPDLAILEQIACDYDTPCALVIAGFHTGRTIVSNFFNLATKFQPENQSASSGASHTHTQRIPPADPRLSAPTTLPTDPTPDTATSPPPYTNAHPDLPPPSTPSPTPTPNPAEANTIPLNLDNLSPSERLACGKLCLADIFEVDVDGRRRSWEAVREGEGKWEAKRWCVVGVLVRR